MSPVDLSEYVSGGYFICRQASRAEHMNPALLPSRIITASDCIVDLIPDAWSLAWTTVSDEERAQQGGRLGLVGPALAGFIDWCTKAFDSGVLGWPAVILDIEAARELRRRFLPGVEGLVLVGIALPRDLVETFAEAARPGTGMGEPGVLTALRRGVPVAEGGIALGFDVLGWDLGAFHSFICSSLENEFDTALGIRPNSHGFFDCIEDARKCAQHASLDTTAADPALWLPWLTVAYDKTFVIPEGQPAGTPPGHSSP